MECLKFSQLSLPCHYHLRYVSYQAWPTGGQLSELVRLLDFVCLTSARFLTVIDSIAFILDQFTVFQSFDFARFPSSVRVPFESLNLSFSSHSFLLWANVLAMIAQSRKCKPTLCRSKIETTTRHSSEWSPYVYGLFDQAVLYCAPRQLWLCCQYPFLQFALFWLWIEDICFLIGCTDELTEATENPRFTSLVCIWDSSSVCAVELTSNLQLST